MDFLTQFELWLEDYLVEAAKTPSSAAILLASQRYSLKNGGKRFRPKLANLIFKLFSDELPKIRAFCLALEMVHTYSLIHDDLPCMDNDDMRRGVPSNHKKFSEDIALLAGDGLLTDVFFLIANDHNLSAEIKVHVIRMLAEKIGSYGMVAGQVKDMQVKRNITVDELKEIHTLKTANLIQAAAMGAAIIADVNYTQLHNISEFGHALGIAFQIKDDLLDLKDNQQDYKSFAVRLGVDEAFGELKNYSAKAAQHLAQLNKPNVKELTDLIEYNLQRTK